MAAIAYPLTFPNRRGRWATDAAFGTSSKPRPEGFLRLVKPTSSVLAPVPYARLEQPAVTGVRYQGRSFEVVGPTVVRPASRAVVQQRRKVFARRRLVASTLLTFGVFIGLWAGTGAIVGSRSDSYVRLANSVQTHSGYLYTVQPGDTLWSIASRLDPSADPRPLMMTLDTQLHGGELQTGQKLLVP